MTIIVTSLVSIGWGFNLWLGMHPIRLVTASNHPTQEKKLSDASGGFVVVVRILKIVVVLVVVLTGLFL